MRCIKLKKIEADEKKSECANNYQKNKMQAWCKILCLTWLGLLMSACNHLFYHPLEEILATPDQFEIDFQSQMIPSEAGVELGSWWMKPSPEIPRRERLVVQMHGNAENMSTHFRYVAWLVREGYDVLSFDYRGYGQSTQQPPTQLGLIADACHVMQWIAQQAQLQKMPVFIIGQSLGGAVAVTSAAQCASPQVKALVLDSTFSSYRDIARDKLGGFFLTWPLQYPLSWLISDAVRPDEAIEKVQVPLLFVHNPADPVVPYSLGRVLFDKAHEPKRFIDVTIQGHTRAFATPESPYRQELLKFFDETLERDARR